MELSLRRLLSLVQELYFASSPGVLATVSTNLVTTTAVLKLNSLFHISADEKGATSVFRVLANHSALSSSFTLSDDSFGLLYVSSISLSLSIRSQSANIFWRLFCPGFVTSAARNWSTFLIPLLTVSLWRPFNSNTEG